MHIYIYIVCVCVCERERDTNLSAWILESAWAQSNPLYSRESHIYSLTTVYCPLPLQIKTMEFDYKQLRQYIDSLLMRIIESYPKILEK